MIDSNLFKEQLDAEWIQLISEAKSLGMNLQEVRAFLKKEKDCLIEGNSIAPLE